MLIFTLMLSYGTNVYAQEEMSATEELETMKISEKNDKEIILSQNNLDLYDSILVEYLQEEEFKRMVKDYGIKYAEEFIEDVFERLSTPVQRGGGGNVCYEYVSNIKQTKTYNCGTTTVLQTLYGMDSADQVSGTSNAAKISTL